MRINFVNQRFVMKNRGKKNVEFLVVIHIQQQQQEQNCYECDNLHQQNTAQLRLGRASKQHFE